MKARGTTSRGRFYRIALAAPLTAGGAVGAHGLADLGHRQAVAGRVVGHLGHVVLDEEQAAAARALEVLDGARVGHVAGVEAGALVRDADLEAVVADAAADVDLLAAVELVAVLDGVDDGFFQGEADAEDLAVLVVEQSQLALDLVLDAGNLLRVARDRNLEGSFLAEHAHDGTLLPCEVRVRPG